ncbi:hypothetical protein HZA99_01560 [Candidatus Woesearchaeota archaeon]|nr:hypothetical protein [Candidatus Woesearchaeota archaeon]
MKFNKSGEISNIQLLLGIIVMFLGTAGAILWGVGIAINNSTFSWLGGTLFALVGFAVAILSRWFK